MSEFHSLSGSLPPIPDNLTIPQYFLDHVTTETRPRRPEHAPWLIEDHSGREIGYHEVKHRTNDLAIALRDKWQLGEDDVVCVFSPNHVDYPVALWAIHRVGAIVTPANPSYTVNELNYQLEASKVKGIIAHPAFFRTTLEAAEKASVPTDRIIFLKDSNVEVPSELSHNTVERYIQYGASTAKTFQDRQLAPGEAKTKLAFLSFSSGTTGKPKAVMIPHAAIIANVLQKVVHLRIHEPAVRRYGPGDVATAVLPFFHIFGLVVNLHYLLYCGLTLVVIPKFDFGRFLQSIVRYNIKALFVVPPQVVLLCKHPLAKKYDINHVRYIMSGAAPLSAEITQELAAVLPNASIGQGFDAGMTESGPTVAMCPPTQKIGTLGSAGQLISGVRARVVKNDGSLAKEGETGELVITSPAVALGYLNNPQATKETFVDGWVRTGDEVVIKNGDMFVVDRIKEIIKVKGFQVAPGRSSFINSLQSANVPPAELEGHLLSHPAVVDACIVGVPDDYSGEVPLGYVKLKEDFAERVKKDGAEGERLKADIVKFVADHKIAYKQLKGGVEFLDVIPKNPSGKLLRRVLRDKARADRAKPKSKL